MVIRRIIRIPWSLRHTCLKEVKKKLGVRCSRPQLIVCLLCCIFLYSFLTPSHDGVISDPRDDPVPPGACSLPDKNKNLNFTSGPGEQLTKGGHYKPTGCIPRQRVAIIIPYRDRARHLKIFLSYMHDYLPSQGLEYTIYIVELAQPTTFNRGLLVNIGATFAMNSETAYNCLVIHDVDLLPMIDSNIYTCGSNPRHMSSANSKFGYRLPYPSYSGGVVSFTPEQFRHINGFSNVYFGWGAEDDDLRMRIAEAGYLLYRVPFEIGVYEAMSHPHDTRNKDNYDRYELLYHAKDRISTDGLNSLKYDLLSMEERPLHTRIYVHVNQSNYDTKPVLSFITKYIFALRPCIFNYFLC